MGFIADRLRVGPSRGDQKIKGLHTCIAGALRHNIEELSVGLGMQFVKNDAMNIKAVLGVGLGRKHLIEAIRGRINNTLRGRQDFYTSAQSGAHSHHIGSNLENNRRLLPVSRAAVHFRSFFTVAASKQKSDRRSKFALSHLFRYFYIRSCKLSVPVGFEGSEDISDDLLLPIDKLERFSGPRTFGVAQAFDKPDCIIGRGFIVMTIFSLELRRRIFL